MGVKSVLPKAPVNPQTVPNLFEVVRTNVINNDHLSLSGIFFSTTLNTEKETNVQRKLLRRGPTKLIDVIDLKQYANTFANHVGLFQNSIFYYLTEYIQGLLVRNKVDAKVTVEVEFMFDEDMKVKKANQLKLCLKFNPKSNAEIGDLRKNTKFIKDFIKIALPFSYLHQSMENTSSSPVIAVSSTVEGIYVLELNTHIPIFSIISMMKSPNEDILSDLEDNEPALFKASEQQWLRVIERQLRLPKKFFQSNHKCLQEWYIIDHLNYCRLDSTNVENEQNLNIDKFKPLDNLTAFDWINEKE